MSFLDRGGGVVAEARIHFGGDAAGHDLENFPAEDHTDLIEGFAHNFISAGGGPQQCAGLLQRAVDELLVGGDLRSGQDQRRVGGRVAGGETADGVDVAGVRDHHGHGGELIEQVGHRGKEVAVWGSGVGQTAALTLARGYGSSVGWRWRLRK